MSSRTIKKEKPAGKVRQKGPLAFCLGVIETTTATVLGFTMVASAVAAGGLVGLAISFRNLPDVRVLHNYTPTETSFIYDVKGKLLTSLHGEANRKVVKLDQISPNLKRAVLAMEDSHFYYHNGINPTGVARAVVVNMTSGSVMEGGSTITMQLIKNLFLTHERSFSRKLSEAVLAIRVEQIFDKNEILEMYLNNIYWGHNNYGIQTASETYFNKSASQLNLAESAMMAGIIQAPEQFSPLVHYEEAKKRQLIVLNRMVELGWINQKDYKAAVNTKLTLGGPTAWRSSILPYVTDSVISELNERFGEENVIKGGLRVQTTIDYNLQKLAEASIKSSYDVLRYSGVRADQIALVAVDPRTHYVKALVGGVDYQKSQFNRASQSRRQPGSAFKPFVYYTAFATGKYTPYSAILDTPISIREGDGWYRPKNYGGGFSGAMSISHAMAVSANVPAVRLGRDIGLQKVIDVCRALGFESPLRPVPSLPLGAIDVTPMEMAGAYATFASNGWHSDTTIIVQVTDSKGNVLLDNTPKPKLVLDPWATASLTSVLKGVINGGTGKHAAIGRPAAGKTGTTDNEKDVWFVGYVPQLATAVWIGNDKYRSLGRGVTGGVYAAPVWRRFMMQALKDEPVMQFPDPKQFPRPRS